MYSYQSVFRIGKQMPIILSILFIINPQKKKNDFPLFLLFSPDMKRDHVKDVILKCLSYNDTCIKCVSLSGICVNKKWKRYTSTGYDYNVTL